MATWSNCSRPVCGRPIDTNLQLQPTIIMKASLSNLVIVASAIFFGVRAYSGVPLAVVQDQTNAVVSWPYPSTGFDLEFSTTASTTGWQPAAGTTVSNNGRWELTAPANLPSGFFRLKRHLQH